MKILMVSAGLYPDRIGGIPAYVEELMAELLIRKYDLAYLDFSGVALWHRTQLSLEKRPHNFPYFKITNSGTFLPWMLWEESPQRQIRSSRRLKRLVSRLVHKEQPDIVHFHELICVPADLLSWLKRLGCKVIFTSQDFYPVCPTVKLFRYDGVNCTLPTSQLICKDCCAFKANRWELRANKFNALIALRFGSRWPRIQRWMGRLLAYPGKLYRRYVLSQANYRARRINFIKHLEQADVVICMSKLHERVIRNIVGAKVTLRQMYLSRQSLKLVPVPAIAARRQLTGPLVFIALNIVEPAKGLHLLHQVFRLLENERGDFELRIYGARGEDTPCIRHLPRYDESQLDQMVAEADFGIVPSLWREAYGYVGVEMLSRGLPILVSAAGAMTEYVQDGTNGMVFSPDEPTGLLDLVRRLLTGPALRQSLWQGAGCTQVSQPFAQHVDAMEQLYTEVHTFGERPNTPVLS